MPTPSFYAIIDLTGGDAGILTENTDSDSKITVHSYAMAY
jgi:hypothetical protein